MKTLLILTTISMLLLSSAAAADNPISFKEAKQQASIEGKPVLLEFFRED